MKKILRILLIVLTLLALVLLAGCGSKQDNQAAQSGAGKSGETITLKFTGIVPTNHYISKYADQVFIKKVEELSQGKVKIEYYPDYQLAKAADMINAANNGVVDIVSACPSYISGKMPLTNVFLLPQAIPDAGVGTKVLWDLVSNKDSVIYKTDYQNNKLVPLFAATLPLYQVVTIEKKPVKSVEDLKGMKLRSAGGSQDLIIKSIGAVPVQMDRSEDYISLQRGTIDGGFFNIPSLKPNKVNEVTRHYTTNANLSSFAFVTEISERSWSKLTPEVKDILLKAGQAATESMAKEVEKLNIEAMKELDQQGFTSYTFKPEESQKIQEMVAPVWGNWVTDMKKLNFDGQKAVDELKEALKKYK